MIRKHLFRITIAATLFLLAVIVAPLILPGGRFDPWLNVILGMIVIPLIFPLIIRWALETKEKHKAISIGLIAFLGFWTLAWVAATIFTAILTFQ